MFIVYSVPSHHMGSTMGAEIAFCLEEIARGQRPGTGDLYSSLLRHPQQISSQDGGRKVAFLYP